MQVIRRAMTSMSIKAGQAKLSVFTIDLDSSCVVAGNNISGHILIESLGTMEVLYVKLTLTISEQYKNRSEVFHSSKHVVAESIIIPLGRTSLPFQIESQPNWPPAFDYPEGSLKYTLVAKIDRGPLRANLRTVNFEVPIAKSPLPVSGPLQWQAVASVRQGWFKKPKQVIVNAHLAGMRTYHGDTRIVGLQFKNFLDKEVACISAQLAIKVGLKQESKKRRYKYIVLRSFELDALPPGEGFGDLQFPSPDYDTCLAMTRGFPPTTFEAQWFDGTAVVLLKYEHGIEIECPFALERDPALLASISAIPKSALPMVIGEQEDSDDEMIHMPESDKYWPDVPPPAYEMPSDGDDDNIEE